MNTDEIEIEEVMQRRLKLMLKMEKRQLNKLKKNIRMKK